MSKAIRNTFIHILLLLIVLNSKTVYYGIINSNMSKVILVICCLFGLMYSAIVRKKFILKKAAILELGILLVLLFLGDIWHRTGIRNVQTFFVVLLTSYIIVTFVTKEEFVRAYTNIISFIAIISLACSVIKIVNPSLPLILAHRIKHNESWYIASPYYTWGWYTISARNFGPFWEPGAFQGFLNIGILFVLTDKFDNRNKIKFVLLSITVLTTLSTTGFIVWGLLLIGYYQEISELLFSKSSGNNKKQMRLLVLASGFAIAIALFTSSTVVNKFDAANISAQSRMNDTIQSIQLCFKNIFLGIGQTSQAAKEIMDRNILTNSNGLLTMIYTFGFPFGIVYIRYLWNSLLCLMGKKLGKIQYLSLFLVLIVLFSTENLYWLEFYCVLLFARYMKNANENRIGIAGLNYVLY